MAAPSVHQRFAVLYGALGGAALGASFAAWTVATSGPGRAAVYASQGPAPAAPRCPEGYAATPAPASAPVVEAGGARPLVRCDPRVSEAPFSEALELLWTNEMYLDARVQAEVLPRFVRAIARGGALVLQPLGGVERVTLGRVAALAQDADGAYQVPPLTVRVWALPAGPNTLQAVMVAPRARAEAATAEARAALARVEGLRPYEPDAPSRRGWNVQVACPPEYSDATTPGGGTSQVAYVGRYCLSPDGVGGTELSFAEVATRADSPEAVRRLFELAAATVAAIGVPTGQGFGPAEPVRVAGVEGMTARMDVDPPAARVRLRAWLSPAGSGTALAVSTALPEHAAVARAAMERWLEESSVVAAYDPAVVAAQRRAYVTRAVVVPAFLSAVLGAGVGLLFRRRGGG